MRWLWLVGLSGCLVSCDKVKEAVGQAKEKLAGSSAPAATTPAGTPDKPGGEIDTALAALIDRNDDGVRFRKDLPFPTDLTVRQIIRRQVVGGRSVVKSAFGDESHTADGSIETTRLWNLKGDRLSMAVDQAAIKKTTPGQAEGPAKDAKESQAPAAFLESFSATFRRVGQSWQVEKPKDQNFKKMVWANSLAPEFPTMAVEAGATTRGQWFGRRLKEGAAFTLSGKELEILFPPGSTGKLEMVFHTIEACSGHPCALFEVKGNVDYTSLLETHKGAHVVTISSGKVWLSVLYPVVMRQEYDMVESFKGTIKGLHAVSNESLQSTTALEWKPGEMR